MKREQLSQIFSFFSILALSLLPISTIFAQDNTQAGLPEEAIARLGKGGINIMQFSPDGTQLAVGTDVGVWLYDVADGKEMALFTEQPGQVNALAFSPDGKLLASGGNLNPIIQLWELDTGNKSATLTLTETYPSLSALAFQGTTLISLEEAGNMIRWDVETGSKLSSKDIVPSLVSAIAFSKDGSIFATGHLEGKIGLWDAMKGRRRANLKGHASFWAFSEFLEDRFDEKANDRAVYAVAFSPDGKLLASGSEDMTAQLWNTEKRKKIATLTEHEGWVTAVAFSEDGKTLATGDANKTVKLWDVDTQKERATLIGHKNTINALTFAPDGTQPYAGCLASGSIDGTIRFWNPETGKELVTFATGHTESVKTVAFSENGTVLASTSIDGVVEMWNMETAQLLTTFTKGQCTAIGVGALSPDATLFASRGSDGLMWFSPDGSSYNGSFTVHNRMKLWDIPNNAEVPTPWLKGEDSANALAFSPNNEILVVGFWLESGLYAGHISAGVELFNFNTKRGVRTNLMFSPNGRLLAADIDRDQTQVWNIETQHNLTPPNIEGADALAFSPDSTILAQAHRQNGIVLWNVTPTGMQERSRISKSQGRSDDMLIFSPDGKTLLQSKKENWQQSIQLWDVDSGEDLGVFNLGHTENITTLAFSHDGEILASGSDDGTVLLWDWHKIISKARENMTD